MAVSGLPRSSAPTPFCSVGSRSTCGVIGGWLPSGLKKMLVGVLGADLIYNSKPPRLPAIIGYILVFASYAGTAAFWSSLRGSHASRRRQPPDQR